MEGGCRARRATRGGNQDERWRRDKKKECKSALVVKRKQLRETEEGGGEGGKRVVMGRGKLTLQNGTLMGARPRLSAPPPLWF